VIEKETYEKLCRTDTEKTKTNSTDIILESLPSSIKAKASRLLTFVTSKNILTWVNNGRLIYAGHPVPGSHIIDLLSLAVKSIHTDKNKNISGLEEFIKLLKNANTPREWFSLPFIRLYDNKEHIPFQSDTREKIINWIPFEEFSNIILT